MFCLATECLINYYADWQNTTIYNFLFFFFSILKFFKFLSHLCNYIILLPEINCVYAVRLWYVSIMLGFKTLRER